MINPQVLLIVGFGMIAIPLGVVIGWPSVSIDLGILAIVGAIVQD
jgi:hypothetical protein